MWARNDSPTFPVIESAFEISFSNEPFSTIHLAAVFSPTPGTEGKLSLGSPRSAAKSQAAGGRYAPQRVRSVQQGMVALHAEERTVPRHLFRFPGALELVPGRAVPRTRACR